jgi:ABC-type siderophore export system fused ATPase/permease subunit
MTLIQVLFFANNGDIAAIITMGLVGFIASFFSKNMIVILFIALTVSSLLKYGIKSNTHEGMENKDEEENDAVANDENMENKEEPTPDETKEDKPKKPAAKKDADAAKNGEVNSAETSDMTKDEKKEEYENLKKDLPEFKEVQAEILKGIERMDPLLQKAEAFINKYAEYQR